MTNKKTDAGTDQRIVLNLNLEQAKQLKGFIFLDGISNPNVNVNEENKKFLQKIYTRIDRTILKQAFIARCQADGIGKPTKEAMKNFMEGIK